MKKLFSILMLLAVVMAVYPIESAAQSKSAKSRAKELKKQHWEYVGSGTLEKALTICEEKKEQGYEEYVGEGESAKKASIAKKKAKEDVMQQIADSGKQIIKGRVTSMASEIDEEETDNLVAGYERLVIRELEKLVSSPIVTLKREKANGGIMYQLIYLVNNNSIKKAQKKAMEEAIEQANLSAKFGDSVSNFIKDGFNAK